MDSRVCRVQPDVPAVARAFDYLVPPELGDAVTVGTIVRIPLHGRRVRGWVLADDVESEVAVAQLRPLRAVVSAGPSPEVVALAQWAAWRWAGPVATFLRAASAPSIVAVGEPPEVDTALYPVAPLPDAFEPADAAAFAEAAVRVVTWPPGDDRRALVRAFLAPEGSTLIVVPEPGRAGGLVAAIAADGREVLHLHGGLSDRERTELWSEARRGATVVVGGRASVWLPIPDLRAVVVIDDNDESLQDERAPTWHAREVALERGHRVGAAVTLLSPGAVARRARADRGADRAVEFPFAGWLAPTGGRRLARRAPGDRPVVERIGTGVAPRRRRRWSCDLRGQSTRARSHHCVPCMSRADAVYDVRCRGQSAGARLGLSTVRHDASAGV